MQFEIIFVHFVTPRYQYHYFVYKAQCDTRFCESYQSNLHSRFQKSIPEMYPILAALTFALPNLGRRCRWGLWWTPLRANRRLDPPPHQEVASTHSLALSPNPRLVGGQKGHSAVPHTAEPGPETCRQRYRSQRSKISRCKSPCPSGSESWPWSQEV